MTSFEVGVALEHHDRRFFSNRVQGLVKAQQPHKVFNLILLDESGSMQSIKQATIDGFNEVVQTVKGVEIQFPEQEHFITLVTFNGLAIKRMIDELSLKNRTFTYIGANHDVADFALKISITNTMSYEANTADMKRMFEREKNARMNYSEKIRNKEDFKNKFYEDDQTEKKDN